MLLVYLQSHIFQTIATISMNILFLHMKTCQQFTSATCCLFWTTSKFINYPVRISIFQHFPGSQALISRSFQDQTLLLRDFPWPEKSMEKIPACVGTLSHILPQSWHLHKHQVQKFWGRRPLDPQTLPFDFTPISYTGASHFSKQMAIDANCDV